MISLARRARKVAGRIINAAPLALWRKALPKAELGVCYHIVSDSPVSHVKHYRFLNTNAFESDLDYLQRHFEFVTYEELARRRTSTSRGRGTAVILTFDDGFSQCASVIAPLLQRRGLRCVFFVVTDLIDNQVLFRESAASLCIEAIVRMPFEQVESIVKDLKLDALLRASPSASFSEPTITRPSGLADLDPDLDPRLFPLLRWLLELPASEESLLGELLVRLGIDSRGYLQRAQPYLTTDQIRQLHADGFVIGAHGCSHRRLQDLSRPEAEHEIVESCRIVRDITGQVSVPFAFPYFGAGLDRVWLAGLRERHPYIGLFFDTEGVREDEPFVVQRVFGERFSGDRSLHAILRRAWAREAPWRRSEQA